MGRSRNPEAQDSLSEQGNQGTADEQSSEKVGRRALLRRAATLAAAGIGGVAATEMLTASPAAAVTGAMQFGTSNNAGGSNTSLTSTAGGSTFEISHTNLIANLRLTPVDDAGDYGDPANPQGDLGGTMRGGELVNLTENVPTDTGTATVDTLFWMAGDNAAADLANLTVVHTSATGTVFAPVGPTRVLDTRSNRALLASQSVLDSAHRLVTAKTLKLQLDSFVKFAYAVHMNITAVTPTGNGFLTVFGSQTGTGGPNQPKASSVSFSSGVTIANHVVSPLTDDFSIFIYTSKTTHIIVDVQGYTLPDFSFLNNNAGALAKLQKGQSTPRFVPGPVPRRIAKG